MKRFVLAMAGASGCVYGLGLLKELVRGSEVHLVMSQTALEILKEETGIDWSSNSEAETRKRIRDQFSTENIHYWSAYNLNAPLSSGSFLIDGMFVVPCSMKTLSGIANGYAGTLIERAADVALKEGRPLLIAPREMPFNAVHLKNMLTLARLGVRVAPPVPAFYHKPSDIDDLVDFVVGKILDTMSIEHDLFTRWEGKQI
jgi:4-hydroxy-3-polyprenylbenzoate decarboxylase